MASARIIKRRTQRAISSHFLCGFSVDAKGIDLWLPRSRKALRITHAEARLIRALLAPLDLPAIGSGAPSSGPSSSTFGSDTHA